MDKKQTKSKALIPSSIIESKILFLRGHKVILDRDLADLYGVVTAQLKRQVKRNIDRFPDDFMFVLNKAEFENWRCQFGTSNKTKMGLRYAPMAFTEHGILMLSSVLNSKRAIHVNIQIMRTFTKLRELMATHKDLRRKIETMEKKCDHQFRIVFEAIQKLLDPPEKPKGRIGFYPHD